MNKLDRFTLFGVSTPRDSNVNKDQRFVNCYPEKTDEQEIHVVKRPGLTTSVTTGDATAGRGVYSWRNTTSADKLISVFSNSIYDSASEIGTNALTNSSGRVWMDEAVDGDLLVLEPHATTHELHYWDGTTFSTLSVTDHPIFGASPTEGLRPGLVVLNGYVFVLSTLGRIWNSEVNDHTSWIADSFIRPNLSQDEPMCIAKHVNYLVYFGSKSVVFFSDAGNPTGSPLKVLGGTGLNIGCAASDTVVNVERTIFWIGKGHGGGHFVAALEGLQAVSVSTKWVEELLDAEGSNISSAYAYTCRVGGHSFYVLTLPTTAQKTIAYDITEGVWCEWTSYNGSTETYFTGIASTHHNGAVYIQDEDNGLVYTISPSVYQDASNTIKVLGVTREWDAGNLYNKFINRLTVYGDKASSDATDLAISYSDDDYTNFSTPRTVDMNDIKPNLTRLGDTQRRSFKYTFEENAPMRLKHFEIDYIEGKGYGY